jgi:hypothetical protein
VVSDLGVFLHPSGYLQPFQHEFQHGLGGLQSEEPSVGVVDPFDPPALGLGRSAPAAFPAVTT